MDVVKLKGNAILPTRGSELAAGYDLYACLDEPLEIRARSTCLVHTGIALRVPSNHYGRIAPRSGLAYRHSLDVGAGVVDEDYSGEIGVVIFNLSDKTYVVQHGDRIAQLIVTPYSSPEINEVDSLKDTTRGTGGYGSTGK